jgi:hypothetical protein
MEFTRYTRYADLTEEELQYLHRVERRTFLNLVNANLIGVRNISLTDNLKANAGLGHCMGPFGDFIDEKIWIAYKKKVKLNAYLREFQNRDAWFFGAGVGINDYPLAKGLDVSANVHYWNQPLKMSFNEIRGESGGAMDISGSYKLPLKHCSQIKYVSLDLGITYKSAGFLPEEFEMGKRFGVRFGLSLGIQDK